LINSHTQSVGVKVIWTALLSITEGLRSSSGDHFPQGSAWEIGSMTWEKKLAEM
jgi:hypothetical protein